MSSSLTITRAVISLAAILAVAGCTDTTSATSLNPDGPPMIEQVRMSESYATDMTGLNFSARRVFAFGSHPKATANDEHPVTSAQAVGQKFRIIIDELLVGNNLEEISCRAPVDSDAWGRVPVGATPDDIAKCAVQNDLLKASCVGDHRVCLCEKDTGCGGTMGTSTFIAKGDPVGVLDTNEDGAADDSRFIAGAVGIKCGSIDVPIDLDSSYWNPSGDQQVPATGGFDALGPAIVLVPNGALPTNITCGLSFDPSVVDKQGNAVCATSDGSVTGSCTPGDVSAFTFKSEALRVTLQGISDNDTGIPRTDPVVIVATAPVDPASINGITMTQNGTAFTGFTISLSTPTTIRLTPTAPTGLAATTPYTVTVPVTLKDAFGQPLPAPVTFHFTTGAT
ncbi:MAG: Bacterial Ig-like domain [Myxococcales bacterium]|nr:Bacterial Ig-like domain [Myxococcales bacterium]